MPTYLGYDPGGNGSHGVAVVDTACRPARAAVHTADDAQDAVDWITHLCSTAPDGMGIDTLLSWELGRSGWRGADLALRARYPQVKRSVTSPNSLHGSMSVQGPAVALRLREEWPGLGVTETHPKLLYFALTGKKYEWSRRSDEMTRWLSREFALPPTPIANDHEWDALVSACAAWCGFEGVWKTDLTNLARSPVSPIARARYFWPVAISLDKTSGTGSEP